MRPIGNKQREIGGTKYAPCLHKNLFCPVRCAGGRCCADVCGQLFESMVGADGHPVERARSVNARATAEHLWAGEHGIVVGRGRSEIHGNVFGLAGGRVYAFGVPGVRRSGYTGPDVGLAIVGALERGVCEVVVGR